MPKIQIRLSKSVLEKLDMIAEVDELTRAEVIRDAIHEYLDDIDWAWYKREYRALLEEDEEDEDEEDEDDEDEDEESEEEE